MKYLPPRVFEDDDRTSGKKVCILSSFVSVSESRMPHHPELHPNRHRCHLSVYWCAVLPSDSFSHQDHSFADDMQRLLSDWCPEIYTAVYLPENIHVYNINIFLSSIIWWTYQNSYLFVFGITTTNWGTFVCHFISFILHSQITIYY